MTTAKLTSRGRITIPIEVRRTMGIQPGVRVEFVKTEAGDYRIKQAVSSEPLRKTLKPRDS